MNGYFIVLGILYISVLTSKCECRKRRDKLRDKTKISQAKEDGIKYSRNVIDLIDELCLPRDTSRLFYRIQNESHIFIGFDDVKHGLVYSMSWKINKNNPGMTTASLNTTLLNMLNTSLCAKMNLRKMFQDFKISKMNQNEIDYLHVMCD
jgi:hypothetical protein